MAGLVTSISRDSAKHARDSEFGPNAYNSLAPTVGRVSICTGSFRDHVLVEVGQGGLLGRIFVKSSQGSSGC